MILNFRLIQVICVSILIIIYHTSEQIQNINNYNDQGLFILIVEDSINKCVIFQDIYRIERF